MTSLHESLAALARQCQGLVSRYTRAPGENGDRVADLLSADTYRIGTEMLALLAAHPDPDPAPSERVELMTENEREALLCACDGEDPTFCLAHGSPPHADPSYQSLDLSGEDLVGRVESILAARLAQQGELESVIAAQDWRLIALRKRAEKVEAERDEWADIATDEKLACDSAEARADALARKVDDLTAISVETAQEQVAAVESVIEEWTASCVTLVSASGDCGCALCDYADDLRAALSDPGTALARVRAEAGAKALEDAAVRASAGLGWEKGGHTSTYSVRKWLRARAADLRAGVEK